MTEKFFQTLCRLVSSADNLCKQFGPRSGLIWIQAVGQSDGIPGRIFRKKNDFEKNQPMRKKHAKLPSRQRVNHDYIGPDKQTFSVEL